MSKRLNEEFDEFEEQLWRQKNILIYNLPESKSRDVKKRIQDDFEEVHRIFNLFEKFEEYDMECMPVRLGRIGDNPRILRVTLKSTYMVKALTNKARDQNTKLNPQETDNKRKIYLNRDYTEKLIKQRKALYDEKKYRESKGEKNLVYRKRKVVPDPRMRSQYSNGGSDSRDRYDNRGYNYSRHDYEGRNENYPNRQTGDKNGRYLEHESDEHKRYRPNNYPNQRNDNRRRNDVRRKDNYQDTENFKKRDDRADIYVDRRNEERIYKQQNFGRQGQQNQNSDIDDRNESFELGISPMNRRNLSSSSLYRDDSGRSPMIREYPSNMVYRDENGPYLRDDSGREIRGAEASSSPSNIHYKGGDHDEYFNAHREQNRRGWEKDHGEYSGRPVREASKMHNIHQPGSKPYGSNHRRR